MKHIKELLVKRIIELKEITRNDDTMSADEKNIEVDRLDELQETLAYRNV